MSNTPRHGTDRASRLARAAALSGVSGKVCPADQATRLLEAIIEPGDRVAIEAIIRRQADFLGRSSGERGSCAGTRPAHGAVCVGAARPSRRVRARYREPPGFCLRGAAKPQACRTSSVSTAVRIGAIHTYLDSTPRALVDLTPRVALVVATRPIATATIYTGPNTEDTPTIIEAAAFHGGIVVAQVNEDRGPAAAGRRARRLGRCRGTEPETLSDRPRCSRAIPPRSGTRTC